MLEFLIIFIFVIFTMVLLKCQKNLMPEKYFYFGRLIDGFDEEISFLGFLFRIAIPLFSSICISIVFILSKMNVSPMTASIIVGFMSAFLLVWPDFYNPELISTKYQTQKKKLFILYLIVMIIFSLMGYLGYVLSLLILKLVFLLDVAKNYIAPFIDTKKLISDIISGTISSIIVAILIGLFFYILNKLKKLFE